MTPVRRSSLQAFVNLSLRLASSDEAAFVKFTLTGERDDDPFRHGIDLSDSELSEKRDPGITLFRKYTSIIGSSFSIELTSGNLYVFRQLAPRVFDRENINLSWDLRLPDRIVVAKEHKHLPLIPIGTWGLNTRLGVVLSGLVTPEGDNSKIPDDKYMEFITLALLPALAELNLEFEDHPEHPEPSAEIPAAQVARFASTLRKIAAEDKTLQWVGKIFFIHQVTNLGVATRHEGNNEHQGLLYLDLAFHHCGLPHLIISDGGHGVWFVSVAIEVRANNRHCVLWKTSAHASAIHELAGITLQSARRLVDVGNPRYSRSFFSHLMDVSGCFVEFDQETRGDAAPRTFYLTHAHAVEKNDPLSFPDILTGTAIPALRANYDKFRRAAFYSDVSVEAGGLVPLSHAATFLAEVPYSTIQQTVYVVQPEAHWGLRALVSLASLKLAETTLSLSVYHRLQSPTIHLMAAIAFLSNTFESTEDANYMYTKMTRFFLPIGSPIPSHIIHQSMTTQPNRTPYADSGFIAVRPFCPSRAAFEEPSPMGVSLGLIECSGRVSIEELRQIVQNSPIALPYSLLTPAPLPLPPACPTPWWRTAEIVYASPTLDTIIPIYRMFDNHFTRGLSSEAQEIFLQFVSDVIYSIPDQVPSLHNDFSSDTFLALEPVQLAELSPGIFQNLRLSDIFTAVQWRRVRDEEEFEATFEALFPNRTWQREDPAVPEQRYYRDWVALAEGLDNQEVHDIKDGLRRLFRMFSWIPYGYRGVWETHPHPGFRRLGGGHRSLPAPKILILRDDNPVWGPHLSDF